MKKLTLIGLIIVVITAVIFIRLTNNHNKCEQKIETVVKADGTKVTTKTHVCNEKFNL